MLLSPEELASLVEVRHNSPHQLLGMHPLGDDSGLVVRGFFPGIKSVEVRPLHDATLPRFQLDPIAETGVFEGVTQAAQQVFAYELVMTQGDGGTWHARDAYSFLPSLSETDLFLFAQGNEHRIYDKLGGHLRVIDGVSGCTFGVWAPNALRVSVVGEFNQWDGRRHAMRLLGASGIWEIFIPDIREGDHYKFEILISTGKVVLKSDPFASFCEAAPKNASIVWNNEKFIWTDQDWMKRRRGFDALRAPVSVYEMHLGSWKKKTATESFSYRELARPLVDYLLRMGFTHVEFMPVAEHAFFPSWGYQVTGFYAPTHRYGTPDDFQFLINALHEVGLGVIVDWVPAHFPRDEWALANFDGTALFEHADPRRGVHQDWGTLIFNYGRHEVRNFLTSNALFWCERFHIDGLRVDAVASMLYLDYSRKAGEWLPNKFGGRENLEAVDFLREMNILVQKAYPGVMTIAEESTSWPRVTQPSSHGGLGFLFKWNMGWMHDTLHYFQREPIHRKYHQNDLTFAMLYQGHENFMLPLSHDEVVHCKGSLLRRMKGDEWQRFANLRCLLTYQWAFPGKKLLFMGGEIAQGIEWDANASVDWGLLETGPYHLGIQRMMADLNHLYRKQRGFWAADYDPNGFYWIDCSDHENSIIAFVRQAEGGSDPVAVIFNFTPTPRYSYRLGLPIAGRWREVFNTNAEPYGGSNLGNCGLVETSPTSSHGHSQSVSLTLPPLTALMLAPGNEVQNV